MARNPNTPPGGDPSASLISTDALDEILARLLTGRGVPVTLNTLAPPIVDTGARLRARPSLTVAFPPCSDELLALIKQPDIDPTTGKTADITKAFNDYFKFRHHSIFTDEFGAQLLERLNEVLDPSLLACLQGGGAGPIFRAAGDPAWPSECCFCTPCVTLDGDRNGLPGAPPPAPGTGIRRLFVGDALWMFYFERIGIHQILGVILDAYAYTGQLPISNGSIELGVKDDVIALVLEAMVRQTKTGLSTTVRDRASVYRTSLGWTSQPARGLNLDTEVNTGFNTLFHRFVFNALEFYKDKRLAVAIRGSAAPVAPPSVATLITISNTIDVLKKRFEAYAYGRNYYNTLAGIVWTIAAMTVIRDLRQTLGIPSAFNSAHEFIPAAYDLLVAKRPVTQGEVNRYVENRRCAENGRDILLDLEVIDHEQNNPGQELDNWLTQIESKVEAYRTAYRNLTGIDLGSGGATMAEQQA